MIGPGRDRMGARARGMLVLMGSGEFTSTMVEVHKEVLRRLGGAPSAVFLDTPAGFQLNGDDISARAVDYFRSRIQHELAVASFKSARELGSFEAEAAFGQLRAADYILVGPGSPTYAVRQWRDSPVPEILTRRVEQGACLVAASAAALTVGRTTLPVYEVYKVGEDPHWVEGTDILGRLGLDLAVIPHWNNAEGGTHDTRRCYLGESRFRALEEQLPPRVGVLGLDEHTACLLDLAADEGQVRGIGRVTFRRGGAEVSFGSGEGFPLELLRQDPARDRDPGLERVSAESGRDRSPTDAGGDPFWTAVHALREVCERGLAEHDMEAVAGSLLELDRRLWETRQGLEDPGAIVEARDLFREMIAALAGRLAAVPSSAEACLGPLVEALLDLRRVFREQGKWAEADAIRDCLHDRQVTVEDTPEGVRWRFAD